MAPAKSTQSSIVSLSRRAISTRTQKVLVDGSQNAMPVGKRKADASPNRNGKGVKRSALGNVTNAVLNAIEDSKKLTRSKTDANAKKVAATLTNQSDCKSNENQAIFVEPTAAQRAHKIVTRASSRATDTKATVTAATAGLKKVNISTTIFKGKKKTETTANNNITKNDCKLPSSGSDSECKIDAKPALRRLSSEFDLLDNEESHYMSALEDS